MKKLTFFAASLLLLFFCSCTSKSSERKALIELNDFNDSWIAGTWNLKIEGNTVLESDVIITGSRNSSPVIFGNDDNVKTLAQFKERVVREKYINMIPDQEKYMDLIREDVRNNTTSVLGNGKLYLNSSKDKVTGFISYKENGKEKSNSFSMVKTGSVPKELSDAVRSIEIDNNKDISKDDWKKLTDVAKAYGGLLNFALDMAEVTDITSTPVDFGKLKKATGSYFRMLDTCVDLAKALED